MWLTVAGVVNLVAISGSGVNIQFCQLKVNSELEFVTRAVGDVLRVLVAVVSWTIASR